MGLGAMKKKSVPSWVDMLGRSREKGDKITGVVVESDMIQQYAFDDDGKPDFDQPLFWDKAETRPKEMPAIIIEFDDEKYPLISLTFTGNGYTALKKELDRVEKLRPDEDYGVVPGDVITVEVVGTGTAKSRGFNKPLLYEVTIKPTSKLAKMKRDEPDSSDEATAESPEVEKPDGVPEVVWKKLSAEDKVAMAAGF